MRRLLPYLFDKPFELIDLVDFLSNYSAHQNLFFLNYSIFFLYLSIYFIVLFFEIFYFILLIFRILNKHFYCLFALFNSLDVPLTFMIKLVLHFSDTNIKLENVFLQLLSEYGFSSIIAHFFFILLNLLFNTLFKLR